MADAKRALVAAYGEDRAEAILADLTSVDWQVIRDGVRQSLIALFARVEAGEFGTVNAGPNGTAVYGDDFDHEAFREAASEEGWGLVGYALIGNPHDDWYEHVDEMLEIYLARFLHGDF